ncbi:MAG: hypothetical protein HY746_04980 [Elusimicrobia bacterium]|nr:hypothetical protein [Elusimicrobiota bacterium]
MKNGKIAAAVLAAIFFASVSGASAEKKKIEIPPLEGLTARDMPYDMGAAALLEWKIRDCDNQDMTYRIFVSSLAGTGPALRSFTEAGWIKVDEFKGNERLAKDIELPFWAWNASKNIHAVKVSLDNFFGKIQDGSVYYFKVMTLRGKQISESPVVPGAVKGNWFNLSRFNNLFYVILISMAFFWAVTHAKKGNLFIRRITGLDAVEEAIGRATEMGKPVYYLTGRLGMGSMSTIAATFILGEISKRIATYDTQLKVPHTEPVTMTVCQEIVKQAYSEAGRQDAYREDINFYVTDDQFAYTAAVDGMMTREKPAACFYMGYYYAESLLLTEIGSHTGAIQIAGTDAEHQLPFFFITCDYTLIGEELYAAGAYLSKDPVLVGTLRGQDIGKVFAMAVILLGAIGLTLAHVRGWDGLTRVIGNLFNSF